MRFLRHCNSLVEYLSILSIRAMWRARGAMLFAAIKVRAARSFAVWAAKACLGRPWLLREEDQVVDQPPKHGTRRQAIAKLTGHPK
jgi:hypothetical protein